MEKSIKEIEVVDPEIVTHKNRDMTITQTSKDKFWYDETTIGVPYNRTTKVERLHERLSAKLLKQAQKLNRDLTQLDKKG